MFNFTTYPELNILMKIKQGLALSEFEVEIEKNERVLAQIKWQFKKFIGSLEIPSYNNL